MKKKVDFLITAFRDGFQSVYGARVLTDDFLPALEAARAAGIEHFEAGGGARFQSLYFYCNEDAFAMMDRFRKTVGPDVNLQTLARGINVVGLESQPRTIIKLHAELFKKHGITTIRNFDALNDVNNLIYSGQCISEAGLNHEVCVTMMGLPPNLKGAHNPEFYIDVLTTILNADIPFNSVCFKDASGTINPRKVYDVIAMARKKLGQNRKIVFHTHETAGASIICYKAAIEAGADQIDLSMAPVSGGTSQPDIVTMWHVLRDSDYDLGIDIKKVLEAEEIFKACMSDYFVPPESRAVEPLIPFSPMPGGALTANTQMMRDNQIFHKYPEVASAMSEAIKRGGFGTSVTPVSQFYFQQAFNNVMNGEWKKISEGYGKMVLGYFGKTPLPPDPQIVNLAREQLKLHPTTESPIDINERDPHKGIETAKKMLKNNSLPINDENIFITAACKEKGIQFLQGEGKIMVRKKEKEEKENIPMSESLIVTVNGTNYNVRLSENRTVVNGVPYTISIKESSDNENNTVKEDEQKTDTVQTVEAPVSGIVLRISVETGDAIDTDQELLVLEAMKMETPVSVSFPGIIEEILVKNGDQVQAGEPLLKVKTR
jgi:pyruvate carboxylase subunit B